MPNPLPILVVGDVDSRELDSWRLLVIAHLNEWAGEILAKTDWYVTRSLDKGSTKKPKAKEVPVEVDTERLAIRDAVEDIEESMLAATTLAEFDLIPWSQTLAALDHTPMTFETL